MTTEHNSDPSFEYELDKLAKRLNDYASYTIAHIGIMNQQIRENAEGLVKSEDIIRECPYVAQFRSTLFLAATAIRNRCNPIRFD